MSVDSATVAVQVMITVIPIVGILMGGAVIILFLILNHKQKMAMIRHNYGSKQPIDIVWISLFAGLLLTFIGFVMSLFFIIKEGVEYSLLSGIVPLAAGMGLMIFFTIARKSGQIDKSSERKE
ncbi:MAG: hypothetical protein JXK07_12555 [Spirochaetes bacterium]|nr:hypothetical protein [Spirochaetota bacterium]MBN2770550.1 hypothetical protein [Spirochaetota bacterium]